MCQKEFFQDDNEISTIRSKNELWLETFMTNTTFEDLSKSDANVTYRVSQKKCNTFVLVCAYYSLL